MSEIIRIIDLWLRRKEKRQELVVRAERMKSLRQQNFDLQQQLNSLQVEKSSAAFCFYEFYYRFILYRKIIQYFILHYFVYWPYALRVDQNIARAPKRPKHTIEQIINPLFI